MKMVELGHENKIIANLRALLERARQHTPAVGYKYGSVMLNEVSACEIAFVQKELDIDISGWKHLIDESALKHVLNRHSTKNAGEVNPLTDDDILLIPVIITEYECLKIEGQNTRGMLTLMYNKEIDNKQYTIEYVAELRTGRKVLALNTMYKKTSRSKRKV